jgi:hypothetical protein
MDGTSTGLYPVAGLGVGGVEISGSSTTELLSYIESALELTEENKIFVRGEITPVNVKLSLYISTKQYRNKFGMEVRTQKCLTSLPNSVQTLASHCDRFTPRGKDPYNLLCVNIRGRLQSSWTHLVTPSRNFVEVR